MAMVLNTKTISFILLLLVKRSLQSCVSSAAVTTCSRETLRPNHPLTIADYKAYLEFTQGDIQSIPPGTFRKLPLVTVLQLSHNKIKTLDEGSFSGLHELKKLNLYDNKLESIGKIFGDFRKLERLDLGMNKIVNVDNEAFDGLVHLIELNMGFNSLTKIPPAVNSLTSLKILSLNNNQIQTLSPRAFSNLLKLETLNLNDNRITQVPRDAFQGLGSLKKLTLSSNYLTDIDVDDLLSDLKRLSQLNININSFTCTNLEKTILKLERKNVVVPKGSSKSRANYNGISCTSN